MRQPGGVQNGGIDHTPIPSPSQRCWQVLCFAPDLAKSRVLVCATPCEIFPVYPTPLVTMDHAFDGVTVNPGSSPECGVKDAQDIQIA